MTILEDIEITVRTYNCLKRALVNTVEELRAVPEEKLLRIRNLGAKCVKEIQEILAKYPQTEATSNE